jgi:hypothetical protein
MIATTIQRATVVLVSVTLFASGCATTRSVPIPKEPAQSVEVNVGDRVEVQTRDGHTQRFTVTAKEPDALRGQHVRVAYADMQSLAVVHSNTGKIAAGVLIAIVVVLAAGLIALAKHGGGLAGG